MVCWAWKSKWRGLKVDDWGEASIVAKRDYISIKTVINFSYTNSNYNLHIQK